MKRAFLILAVTMLGILLALKDAYFGLLLYSWLSFSAALSLEYGLLQPFRILFFVAYFTIFLTIVQYKQLFFRNLITSTALAFVVGCALSLITKREYSFGYVAGECWLLLRMVLIAIVTPVLLSSAVKLRGYIAVIAFSSALLGAYYGAFGLFAGSREIIGPGKAGDNNGYAVWLTVSLPFIFFALRHIKKFGTQLETLNRLQIFGYLILIGNLLAIALTFSRAGIINACIVIFALTLCVRSRQLRALLILIALPFGIIWFSAVFYAEPSSFVDIYEIEHSSAARDTALALLERLQTMKENPTEIASLSGRMHFWKVATNMFLDHPLFGIGLKNYQRFYDEYDTSDGLYGKERAVHNTPFVILSETGLAGAIPFSVMILVCLISLTKIRKQTFKFADSSLGEEFRDYVTMLRIALLGFLFGTMFVDCLYHEYLWAIFSITIAMDNLSRKAPRTT